MDVYQVTNTEGFADSVYLILNPNTTQNESTNASTMSVMLPTASTFHATVSVTPTATYPARSLLSQVPTATVSVTPTATYPARSLLSQVPTATVSVLSLLPSVSPTVSVSSGPCLMASFWALVICVHTAAYFLASA